MKKNEKIRVADKKPLVTIVTVTFNIIKNGRKKYFRQCLESVHNQTYKNIEHIVIDGASNDGTLNLVKEYADKGWITYISEHDNGIYDAMNKGIKIAKGKYIAFLNSDDFYHNNDTVKISVEKLEENNADFSYANFISIDSGRKVIIRGELEKFLYTMPFGHPTMFVKTLVILKEGSFNEKYGLPSDYELIIRLILKDYRNIYINEELATYRIGGLGSSTDYSTEIAKIYYDRYSAFHKFSNLEEARDIMYGMKLPENFIANFRSYANKEKYKNIDIEKVISLLICNLSECEGKNFFETNIVKEGIPVFLSSDNNYAPFVATTISSIMENTASYIDFYILDGGISIENVKKIKELKKIFPNFSIEFIEINTREKFAGFPERLHFSIDMYTRFLIPELKPDLKKIIYSDVDVIFMDDIVKLFNEDLENKVLGAVPYSFGYLNPNKKEIKDYHKRLNLSDTHKYFESGLLLIDGNLWRKRNLTEKLMREVKRNSRDIILTPDQDVFNIVLENDYKELDNKYIVVPHREKIMKTSAETRKSILKPFIIHFAGSEKPWKNPKMQLAYHFWRNARHTVFYEELIFNFCEANFLVNTIYNHNEEKKKMNFTKFDLKNKFLFVIFSPKKFIKKYINVILNSKLRQPARKIYYAIRFKKIK